MVNPASIMGAGSFDNLGYHFIVDIPPHTHYICFHADTNPSRQLSITRLIYFIVHTQAYDYKTFLSGNGLFLYRPH